MNQKDKNGEPYYDDLEKSLSDKSDNEADNDSNGKMEFDDDNDESNE